MVPIKYNIRNLVVRKRTTFAASFGLAMVVFVFASALMLANGIERTFGRTSGADIAIVLRKGSDVELSSGIDDNQVNLVIAQAQQIGASKEPAGIGEVVALILLEKVGVQGYSNVTVRGTPDEVYKFRSTVKIVEGRAAKPGADEVVVGKAIYKRFKGVTLDDTIELKKNRPVKVVGVFTDEGSSFESEIWSDVHIARQAFGREGRVSSVRVHLDSPGKFDAFEAVIEGDRQLGLEVMREQDFFEKQSSQTAMILRLLGGMVAFFLGIGAMIGATITMNAQVSGRSREIGTLRALGFTRAEVLFSFLLESFVLALAGGLVGAVLSLGMGMVKITMLNANTWSEIVFGFEPTPKIIVSALILAGGMGVLGGFLPAVRAARSSPIEAMRA